MEFNKEALELELMNAHIAVENNRAEAALFFLAKIEPSQLAPGLEAVYHSIEGQAKVLQKDYRAGIALLRQALQEYARDALADTLQIERVRDRVGQACHAQGDIIQALEEHRLCLKAILETGIDDARFLVSIFFNLGNDYFQLGQKERAFYFYCQALEQAEAGEDREDLAGIYRGMGLIYLGRNDLDDARSYLLQSVEQFLKAGNQAQARQSRSLLGLVLLEKGEFEIARRTLEEVFRSAQAAPGPDYPALASASAHLAGLYRQQYDYAEAERWGNLGLAYAAKTADLPVISQAQLKLAAIKMRPGHEQEALALFQQAAAAIEATGHLEIASQIFYAYGCALRQLGRLEDAFEWLNKSCLIKTASYQDCFLRLKENKV